MSEELIKKIALEIITNTIFANLYFYAIYFAFSLASGAVILFGSTYLKKRGENFATKQDFDNLLQQLKISTESIESIKAKISSEFAEASARKVLMREKLEIFIETIFFVEQWLEKTPNILMRDDEKIIEFSNSQLSRLLVYQMTYFPDVKVELDQFAKKAEAVWHWNSNTLYLMRRAKVDTTVDLDQIDILAFQNNEQSEFRSAAIDLQKAILSKYSKQAGL